jgi:hypothetical protein
MQGTFCANLAPLDNLAERSLPRVDVCMPVSAVRQITPRCSNADANVNAYADLRSGLSHALSLLVYRVVSCIGRILIAIADVALQALDPAYV